MLKNEELIYKMSVEQKVELILSSKQYSNHSVGSYEFPTFLMKSNPLHDEKNIHATFFPSDKALASSFNMKLVSLMYNLKGIETKASLDTPFFNITNNPTIENISEDVFLSSKFLSSKVKGLNTCNAVVNFEQQELSGDIHEQKETLTYFQEEVLKDSYFKSILVNNVKDLYDYKVKNENNEISFSKASTPQEVLNLIVSGCCLVYIDDSILEETITFVSECVHKYKRLSKDYSLRKLTEAEYKKAILAEDVLSETILDNACDAIMNLLLDLTNSKRTISERLKTISNDGHQAKFNEVEHDIQAANAAKETIVLLKNKRVLPFKYTNKLAIIGEYAKEESAVNVDALNKVTTTKLAYNIINDYDLTTVGFAYGYKDGTEEDEQLLEAAVKLSTEADYSVVFLHAKQGETTLPKQQLDLIDALYNAKAKIVAVVVANNAIDLSFDEKCEAVLFTYNAGQQTTSAVLNILSGLDNPSAKLIENFYVENEEEKVLKYPFGHGLSYSTFEYYNLEVKENYVSLSVTNTSDFDGYVIPQLYILKEGSVSTLGKQQLKGFNKVFLRAHETLKVEIPIDENTFKVYDEQLQKYCVEGGNYQIILAESSNEVRIKGTVTLARYVYNEEVFVNTVEETSNDFDSVMKKFAQTESKKEYMAKGKGAPFGLKLALAISLATYFNIVILVFLIGGIDNDTGLPLMVVLFLLFVAINLFAILYIVKISKKRIAFLRKTPNETLTKVIDGIREFTELEKTLYKEPVSEEQVEEEPQALEEEVQPQVEEQQEIVYQSNFDYEEDVEFKENLTLPELCNNFREYAASKGIIIEPASVRTMFSALASSKIIFLDIKNKDALGQFLNILNDYFSSSGILSETEDFESSFDLIWRQEEERYVPTEFIKAVRTAEQDKKRTSIAIIDNVTMSNFYNYFNTFVEFALHPTEVYELEVNEELTVRLPSNINYIIVPTEDDYMERFTKDLAKASVCVELVISRTDEVHEDVEIKSIAYPEFLTLIAEAKENHYLEEKVWKKIDELVENINLTEKFGFGNKNILQLERLTSTLIECGGDEQEAFTVAFVSKVIPVLKTLKTYKKENGDKTIFGIIEKLFADEDLAKIQKTLTKKF